MKTLKLIIHIIGKILVAIFSFLIIYLVAAVILALVPYNNNFEEPEQGIHILISSNGVHADLVLPIDTVGIDWREFIDPLDFEGSPEEFAYIGFGWGDENFYIQTPTWSDLRFDVAANAVLIPSQAAFNVTYYAQKPEMNDLTRGVIISNEQYRKLVSFIKASFIVDEENKPVLIEGVPYVTNNNFYKAKGKYHLLNTSNNWTNRALKEIGVKTATWAPFDRSILHHF